MPNLKQLLVPIKYHDRNFKTQNGFSQNMTPLWQTYTLQPQPANLELPLCPLHHMKVDDKRFNAVPFPWDYVYYICKIWYQLVAQRFLFVNALRCFGQSHWPFSGRSEVYQHVRVMLQLVWYKLLYMSTIITIIMNIKCYNS